MSNVVCLPRVSEQKIPLRERQHVRRRGAKLLAIGRHDIRFRIDMNPRQRVVELHVALAQAAAPSLGALLMERLGPLGTLETLFAIAIANVILVLALLAILPRRPS